MKKLYDLLPAVWGLMWVFVITMGSLAILIWVSKWLFSLIGLI